MRGWVGRDWCVEAPRPAPLLEVTCTPANSVTAAPHRVGLAVTVTVVKSVTSQNDTISFVTTSVTRSQLRYVVVTVLTDLVVTASPRVDVCVRQVRLYCIRLAKKLVFPHPFQWHIQFSWWCCK